MGSLITDNTSSDTFLPTEGGEQKREGGFQTWSQMRRQKPAHIVSVHLFICSCVREESECCHPTHSLILIEIYVCLDLTHLTEVCWAMSVTRCDTVTHGADHTHDTGSVSANQRPVWRLLTNERPVKWPRVTARGWGMLGMLHWISTKRRTRLTQSEASVSSIWPMREEHLLWRGCTGSLVSHLSRQL